MSKLNKKQIEQMFNESNLTIVRQKTYAPNLIKDCLRGYSVPTPESEKNL